MFKGSIVALITPMDNAGKIDIISLKKLIDYHIESGTKAIVAAGTTGESPTLSNKERMELIIWILELSYGRIPIIVGTGTNSTSEAILLTSKFNNIGVSGCLSVTPYYNQPTQEGIFQHFRSIAENTNLPQIIYNIPTRTGCDILPETIARLSEIKNIIGIKEATKNLGRVNQIKELVDEDFILLSGDDVTALDFIQLGGNGVISVTANIIAKEMSKIYKLANENNFREARRLNNRLMLLHHSLFFEPNPIPVKWACKRLGLIRTDTLRLPMTSLTKEGINVVSMELKNANLI